MPNAQYKRGAGFEYKVMADMKEEGFYCIRSAGSHGMIDIVALKGPWTCLIQCKHTKKKEINLTEILKGDNIKLFEEFKAPNSTLKFLIIKQGRSKDLLILRFNAIINKWVASHLNVI